MVREKITAKRKSGKEPRTVSFSVIIVILIVGVVALVGFLTFLSIGPPPPSKPSYCAFRLVDTETGADVSGEILLLKYDETEKKYSHNDYDNLIETSKTIFLSEPCLTTIYSVTLKTDPSMILLPFTISPITSDDPNELAINIFHIRSK